MDLITAKNFYKSGVCPSAESLLAFSNAELSQPEMIYISAHLASCDFCAAELHFLTSIPPPETNYGQPTEIPFALKQLAEVLLGGKQKEFQLLDILMSNSEHLSLNNA